MAVKTPFSDETFRHLLSRYDLGDYRSSSPISAGTVQTNYIIQTGRGKFVFRCYENRSRESVGFECNLLKYLTDRRYPCPAPLKNKGGRHVGSFNEKPFVIFEFIEGQHLENPSKAQESQLIQKVAELHSLTAHYRPRGWQHRWNYNPALCRELAQNAAQAINTPNAQKKLAWYLDELGKLDLPTSLPKGVCHCDFHFSNILFKNGQFAALIDFDDANYTYLVFDLITLMNPFIPTFNWDTWSQFPEGENIFDFQNSRAVVAEYSQYRCLSPIEKRHLFDVYKFSILIDCLWYFARGDVSDFYEKRKLNALDRLGRDNFYAALFS